MSCEWLAYLTSAGVPRPDMISSQFLTLLVYSRVRRFESRDELIRCLFWLLLDNGNLENGHLWGERPTEKGLVIRFLYAHKRITEGLGLDVKLAPDIRERKHEPYILGRRDAKVNPENDKSLKRCGGLNEGRGAACIHIQLDTSRGHSLRSRSHPQETKVDPQGDDDIEAHALRHHDGMVR